MNAMVSTGPDSLGISEHAHLALMSRDAATKSGGRSLIDTSADLLRTIGEVLDIRSVFPRVSEIVKPVLRHDALDLMFFDREGEVTLEARSTDDVAEHDRAAETDDEPFYIVSDLSRWRRGRPRREAADV